MALSSGPGGNIGIVTDSERKAEQLKIRKAAVTESIEEQFKIFQDGGDLGVLKDIILMMFENGASLYIPAGWKREITPEEMDNLLDVICIRMDLLEKTEKIVENFNIKKQKKIVLDSRNDFKEKKNILALQQIVDLVYENDRWDRLRQGQFDEMCIFISHSYRLFQKFQEIIDQANGEKKETKIGKEVEQTENKILDVISINTGDVKLPNSEGLKLMHESVKKYRNKLVKEKKAKELTLISSCIRSNGQIDFDFISDNAEEKKVFKDMFDRANKDSNGEVSTFDEQYRAWKAEHERSKEENSDKKFNPLEDAKKLIKYAREDLEEGKEYEKMQDIRNLIGGADYPQDVQEMNTKQINTMLETVVADIDIYGAFEEMYGFLEKKKSPKVEKKDYIIVDGGKIMRPEGLDNTSKYIQAFRQKALEYKLVTALTRLGYLINKDGSIDFSSLYEEEDRQVIKDMIQRANQNGHEVVTYEDQYQAWKTNQEGEKEKQIEAPNQEHGLIPKGLSNANRGIQEYRKKMEKDGNTEAMKLIKNVFLDHGEIDNVREYHPSYKAVTAMYERVIDTYKTEEERSKKVVTNEEKEQSNYLRPDGFEYASDQAKEYRSTLLDTNNKKTTKQIEDAELMEQLKKLVSYNSDRTVNIIPLGRTFNADLSGKNKYVDHAEAKELAEKKGYRLMNDYTNLTPKEDYQHTDFYKIVSLFNMDKTATKLDTQEAQKIFSNMAGASKLYWTDTNKRYEDGHKDSENGFGYKENKNGYKDDKNISVRNLKRFIRVRRDPSNQAIAAGIKKGN